MTDPRTTQYWDAQEAVVGPYTDMFSLTGPCAGIFMVFGPDARWEDGVPRPDYAEDAHALEFKRPLPQFDGERFAATVLAMLP
ncbi:MAG: hypothetical protein V3T16_05905 [Gemmatimonadales bacterium]